jgi:hypothetical protein
LRHMRRFKWQLCHLDWLRVRGYIGWNESVERDECDMHNYLLIRIE